MNWEVFMDKIGNLVEKVAILAMLNVASFDKRHFKRL